MAFPDYFVTSASFSSRATPRPGRSAPGGTGTPRLPSEMLSCAAAPVSGGALGTARRCPASAAPPPSSRPASRRPWSYTSCADGPVLMPRLGCPWLYAPPQLALVYAPPTGESGQLKTTLSCAGSLGSQPDLVTATCVRVQDVCVSLCAPLIHTRAHPLVDIPPPSPLPPTSRHPDNWRILPVRRRGRPSDTQCNSENV